MNLIKSLEKEARRRLGYGPVKRSNGALDGYSGALGDLVAEKRKNMSMKWLSTREDSKRYNDEIAKMEPAFNFLNEGLYKENPGVEELSDYDGFNGGSPLKWKPFPGAVRAAKKALYSKEIYKYPFISGDLRSRQRVLDYLAREGVDITSDKIGCENVIFACSTTHAYYLALKAVAEPDDVILMTAPNYGLFAIMTELANYHLETIVLKEEDDWFVNPKALAKRIDEINAELKRKHTGKGRAPKVAAFVNINPHNPMGNVISKQNHEILEGIAEVCLEKKVFVIDDLVYRDLTYDLDNLALPMISYPKYFDNTISLFGLSKAFGLAGMRAAVIVAPLPVANLMFMKMHHMMDSAPTVQVAAIGGTFNGTDRRYKEWRRYLTPIIREYKYRYQLLKALVYGVDTVSDRRLRTKIRRDISRYAKDYSNELCKGCGDLIKIKVEPRSGFFAVFDFTAIKGKKTPDGKVILNECDLLSYFFSKGGLRYLMGGNIFWPNPDEFVGRISYGIERKNIVSNMQIMHQAIKELK